MPLTLAQVITQLMSEKGLSGYDIERKTKRAITQSYVNRIKNGEVKTPSAVKVQALAVGLDVQESILFAAIRGVSPSKGELSHDRLQSIDFAYEGMPKAKQEKADYVIELLEREIKRIIEG